MPDKFDQNGWSFIDQLAKDDFQAALRKGFWKSVLNWFAQGENKLLPFDEVRKNLPYQQEHYVGLREIPVEDIVGSLGRYQDFDREFLPRQSNTKDRWISIDKAHLQDVVLPPIEVYKLGSVYFVKDGNHRVSVARERGQAFVDANVIEINVPVTIDSSMDIDTLIGKKEQIEFLQTTNLQEIAPAGQMELTVVGGYGKLLEHIQTHQWFMGERRNTAVDWKEAVKDWYQNVYQPLVKVIRENSVLSDFPGRTETDLYLWIIEHLWYLREEYRGQVSIEEAAEDFTDKFSEKPLSRILRIIRQTAGLIPGGHVVNPEDSTPKEDESKEQSA